MKKDSNVENQNSAEHCGGPIQNTAPNSPEIEDVESLERIQEIEARYRALFDRSVNCVYIHDFNGRFLDANEAALRLLEYKREEIGSINFASLLDKNQVSVAYRIIEELMRKGSIKEAKQYKLKTKSGKQVWVETDASVIYKQGKPYAIQGVAKDITDRKKAEEALRESEEKYRTLFSDSRDAIYIISRDGQFLDVNSAFLKLYGYTREELNHINARELYANPHDRDKFQKQIEKEGSVENYPLKGIRKDGTAIELLITSALRRSEKDGILCYQGIVRDITAQKGAEEGLKESEAHYRAMVEAFDGLLYICSPDYRVEFMNQQLIERTGYNPIGEFCYKALHDLDSVCEWCVHERVLKGEIVHSEVLSPKDNRWYYIVNSPIYHADGSLSKQAMILDITDRKKMEEEIKESAEKIRLFAYSVSHDLKNPAISTHGLAKRLQEKYKGLLDEKGQKYCDQIINASEQISELVNQINVYISSKEAPLKIEMINLKEISLIIKEEFSTQLITRQIAWKEPSHLPNINADRLSVIRILRNLVDNALKYGGKALSEIEIGYNDSVDHHILSVKDNGVGIEKGDSKKIFGLFIRRNTSKGIQGTGLGLAIVKEIAERHAGRVWAEPETKKGITFFVSLSKHLPQTNAQ